MSKLGRLAHLTQVGGLYVLVALLPFSKAAVEICFGFLFIGWVVERLNPATRAQTVWRSAALRPVLLGLVSYLAVCAVSIVGSDYPGKSLHGFISKWVEYLLFVVIIADVAARPGVAPRSLTIVAWSSLAVMVQAIAQELLLLHLRSVSAAYPVRPFGAYARMTGPYENPIDLATYLMVVIPLLLTWRLTRHAGSRWLTAGYLALLIGCMARTEASGAWLGLGIAVGMLVLAERAVRRAGLALVVILAVGVLACLAVAGRLQSFSPVDIGVVDRWTMWQAAIRMIQDRPWLGHGVNTFMANYLRYRVGGEAFPRYAHNCYLQVAAETGLVGLASFTALLWLLFARLGQGLRLLAVRSEARVLLLGCVAGLAAFIVQAAVDTNFYSLRQAALFWALAGVALGLSLPPREIPP